MNAQELKSARLGLGWSRQDLAQRAGLSTYQVAILEQGRRSPTESEEQALRSVLIQELDRALVESGEHPIVIVDEPSDVTRTAEWNGIRRGDLVQVAGLRGQFRFLYYHRDPKQEYVEVYGPERKPKERSVTPDRVTVK